MSYSSLIFCFFNYLAENDNNNSHDANDNNGTVGIDSSAQCDLSDLSISVQSSVENCYNLLTNSSDSDPVNGIYYILYVFVDCVSLMSFM